MQAIVNVDQNWGIGCGGDLLFPIPEDMRFFRESTLHKTVVMGSRTLASFPGGKPLKNRTGILLSRQKGLEVTGVTVADGLPALAQALAGTPPEDVFVIGGQQVYALLIDYCATALVTRVEAAGEADTFFPNLDTRPGWALAERSAPHRHEGVTFRFCTYRNSAPKPLPV